MLDPKNVDVVILCGGKGTRLRSVVNDRPKAMADINGRPFLDILIEYIMSFGFRRFILCTGYMGDVIRNHYENRTDAEFIISHETTPLGTMGAVKNAQEHIHGNFFLVLNGDTFCEVNYLRFISPWPNRTYYPETKYIISKHANNHTSAGIYLFYSSVLNQLRVGSFEHDIYSPLNLPSMQYFIDKEVIDIGTPERYEYAKAYFASRGNSCGYRSAR